MQCDLVLGAATVFAGLGKHGQRGIDPGDSKACFSQTASVTPSSATSIQKRSARMNAKLGKPLADVVAFLRYRARGEEVICPRIFAIVRPGTGCHIWQGLRPNGMELTGGPLPGTQRPHAGRPC